MTVLEIIQKSTSYLTGKGVDSARLQSESLLAHVLQMPRMQLYLNFQRTLSEAEIAECRELVRRRGNREPLQHLLGSVSFIGIELSVGSGALIPRPETEQLVELALGFLRSIDCANAAVLDFGTGTGCIAIAVASVLPNVTLTACDISPEALALAQANALRCGVDARIQFVRGDGFGALSEGAVFDLILSNPPYIPTQEIDTLEPEVRDHDPRLALDGGRDGLDFYRLLARNARTHLKKTSALIVEFGDGQAPAITALFAAEKWIVEAPRPDYSGRERFLMARPSP